MVRHTVGGHLVFAEWQTNQLAKVTGRSDLPWFVQIFDGAVETTTWGAASGRDVRSQ